MKIGIIFKPFVDIKIPFSGGMGNFTYLLSENLAKEGHEVSVLCGKDSQLPEGVNHISPEYLKENYNTYKAGEDFYNLAHKLNDSMKIVNESFGEQSKRFNNNINFVLDSVLNLKEQNYDILHFVTHEPLSLYAGLLSKIPSVVSLHGHYDYMGPDFLKFLESIKKRQRSNMTFVSVSKYIQNEYKKYINSELIYNAIDVSKIKPTYKKENYIAFLGRIDEFKGLDFAVNFSKKYNIPLKIGGSVENKYFFETKIEPQIDEKLIQYLGHQNEDQKQELLGKARALLMSSRYNEAFGRVTAEALACGTPVIGFDKGATPEILNEETGFLIKEDNFEEAKEAWDNIDKIDPKKCRKHAEENFDIKRQIEEYEKLYKEIS